MKSMKATFMFLVLLYFYPALAQENVIKSCLSSKMIELDAAIAQLVQADKAYSFANIQYTTLEPVQARLLATKAEQLATANVKVNAIKAALLNCAP